MEIKSEKQQYRDKINELDSLIDFQSDNVNKASKKYWRKKNWLFPQFVDGDIEVLSLKWEKEKKIYNSLKEYRNLIADKLIS